MYIYCGRFEYTSTRCQHWDATAIPELVDVFDGLLKQILRKESDGNF